MEMIKDQGAAIHLRRPGGPAPQVMSTQIPRDEVGSWIADHDETEHAFRPVVEIFLVPDPAAFGSIAAPLQALRAPVLQTGHGRQRAGEGDPADVEAAIAPGD